MNNDINNTLQALVPILQMNGENVQSIEAVQDWYNINGTEYMKEVAEITYTSGYRIYADIGCDANLTAVYDVMAVLQEIKLCSKCIGRIVRGVYEMPAVEHPDINVGSMDTISRKAAIDAVFSEPLYEPGLKKRDADVVVPAIYDKIKSLPPAQPDIIYCKDCAYCDSDVVDAPYGMTKKIFWCDRLYAGANENLIVEPDDFCSWAERREDGQTDFTASCD